MTEAQYEEERAVTVDWALGFADMEAEMEKDAAEKQK